MIQINMSCKLLNTIYNYIRVKNKLPCIINIKKFSLSQCIIQDIFGEWPQKEEVNLFYCMIQDIFDDKS